MNIRSILSLVLCLLLLATLGGTCGAQAMYQLTESQLTQLESNINQLELNNSEQEKQLQKVSELLVMSDKQTQILSEKLTLAEQSIMRAQSDLQIANESLEKLEKAEKSRIRALTFQRDILIVGLAYMAFKK